jgi:Tol biopolymer transport system component
MERCTAWRSTAASPRSFPPLRKSTAITITASRPTDKFLAISDQSTDDHKSRVYIVPITGGTPRLITPNAPSYWHGWSPDGKTLAFTGSARQLRHLLHPAAGGEETRLTTAPGLDDGPEYSPTARGSTSTPSAPATCRFGA